MKSLREILKKDKLIGILLAGLLLLIISLPVKKPQEDTDLVVKEEEMQDSEGKEESWQEHMEEKLEKILEKTQGVGDAEVFLTCGSTEKKIVEKDEADTVYEKDAKGNQSPYVASEVYPEVTGVVVIAKGGDDPVVVRNIQEAVEALFQVEAHKIKVMKMN